MSITMVALCLAAVYFGINMLDSGKSNLQKWLAAVAIFVVGVYGWAEIL